MAKSCKWISIEDILDEIYLINDKVDKQFILTHGLQTVQRVLTADSWEIKLKVINVEDYSAELPSDFKQMCDVLYNKKKDYKCGDREVYGYVKKIIGSDCKVSCSMCDKGNTNHNCDTCLDLTPGSQDLRYNPEWFYQKVRWTEAYYDSGRDCCKKDAPCDFRPIQPSIDAWHQSERFCKGLNMQCQDEYKIEKCGCRITTSFKEGKLLIAYLAECCDDNDIPLIPNDTLIIDAILHTVNYKWMYKMYIDSLTDREATQALRVAYQELKQISELHIARAREKYRLPSPDELKRIIKKTIKQNIY